MHFILLGAFIRGGIRCRYLFIHWRVWIICFSYLVETIFTARVLTRSHVDSKVSIFLSRKQTLHGCSFFKFSKDQVTQVYKGHIDKQTLLEQLPATVYGVKYKGKCN